MVELLEQSVIYDNPRPHVHSRHGYFPGMAQLPSGELICLFVIAEAFEAPNATTWITRSYDEGRSWTLQGRLYDKTIVGFETSDYLKPTVLRDGTLLAIGYRFHRHDPEQAITIPETGGMLPGDNLVSHSTDDGHTWSIPACLLRRYPELLEVSGPAIELRSGDLLAVGALCKTPEGTNPSGQFGVLLRSVDRGRTWEDSVRYFETPGRNIAPFEARLCEMGDGRIAAIVWAYDLDANEHLPNHVVVSHDGGIGWSAPIDTGLMGQASNVSWLGGDLLLTIQAHRGADPGIFVRIVDFSNDEWKPQSELLIYGSRLVSQTHEGQSMSEMFQSLRFGQPSLLKLASGDYLACHWCVEGGQGKIRAHRIRVNAR
jgi:sialidase-1